MKHFLLRFLPFILAYLLCAYSGWQFTKWAGLLSEHAQGNPALQAAAGAHTAVGIAMGCFLFALGTVGAMFVQMWKDLDTKEKRIRHLEEELKSRPEPSPIAPPPPPRDAIKART